MKYAGLETETVTTWRNGGLDANGQPPEHATSDGHGNPCRHCLQDIPEGTPMLVLAHRPFPTLQPYAETGPIFVCDQHCLSGTSSTPPEILTTSPDYLVKGYGVDDRIIYGTGAVIVAGQLDAYAQKLFERSEIAYLHVRSARNNCYQLRIDR